MYGWQSQFLIWLQRVVFTTVPDIVVVFCARYIPWIFIGLLIVVVLYHIMNNIIFKKHEHWFRFSIGLIITSVVALVIQWIMKTIFATGRPFTMGINSIYQYGHSDSFPSGHATVFMAISLYVFNKNKFWGSVCLAATIIIGCARMIAGIHWPIDILGGFIIGIFVAVGMISLIKMV